MELIQDYTSDDDETEASSAVGPLEAPDEQNRARNAHQGRLRSFPHQEGNYATYVYFSGATLYLRWDASLLCIHSSASHLGLQASISDISQTWGPMAGVGEALTRATEA